MLPGQPLVKCIFVVMIEIIILVFLCIKLRNILLDKGWEKTIWMQLALIGIYLGSLFVGSFVYTAVILFTQGQYAAENVGLSAYFAGYVGVLIGVGALFFWAKKLKPKEDITH